MGHSIGGIIHNRFAISDIPPSNPSSELTISPEVLKEMCDESS